MRVCAGIVIRAVTAAVLMGGSVIGQESGQAYEEAVGRALQNVDAVVAKGPFAPTWDSLETYEPPAWYVDGKFGIFIHWGVYSVPGFGNEWYPREMYREGSAVFKHHVATYGPHTQFGYKDFIPLFTAEKFDPDAWADLFRRAGAKFVAPVAEHHDGFAMYDCSFSPWCAAQMGPKRDVIGELAASVRKQGLVFGLSSHRAEHWWFFDGGRNFDSDVQDPQYAGLYGPAQPEKESTPDAAFLDDWLARCTELVDKYQPQLFWFDWWIEQPVFEPYRQRFAAYYYNRGVEWGQGVAINYKNAAFPPGAAVWDIERGQLDDLRADFWQTDTSISKNSWGFVQKQFYKTAEAIIGDFVDIVSKNGALLLNIGPRPDGTIPEKEQEILLEIGRWLEVNGEAIYGARPWKVFGEGPTNVVGGSFNDTRRKAFTARDIRFTTKGGALYAVFLAWPEQGRVRVKSLGAGNDLMPGEIARVELLGHDGPLEFTRAHSALVVTLPGQPPCTHAYALKITPADEVGAEIR